MLVYDTQKPNKEPFEVSEAGYQLLRSRHGDRYQSNEKVITLPSKIILPPTKVDIRGKAQSRKQQ